MDRDVPEPGHLPEPSEYRLAIEKAWNDLGRRNPIEVAADADVKLISHVSPSDSGVSAIYETRFLDDTLTVDVGARRINRMDGSELTSWRSVLVLHYLVGARPGGVSADWLTFRELEAGQFYLPAFEGRSVNILKPLIGEQPELLLSASVPLGGQPIDIGDVGVRFTVLPKVHVAVVVWAGDEDLSPSVTMLFGRMAEDIFPTEDLAVMGGLVAVAIAKNIWNK